MTGNFRWVLIKVNSFDQTGGERLMQIIQSGHKVSVVSLGVSGGTNGSLD